MSRKKPVKLFMAIFLDCEKANKHSLFYSTELTIHPGDSVIANYPAINKLTNNIIFYKLYFLLDFWGKI